MKKTPKKAIGPAAVDILEEAIHLLRHQPRGLFWYYAGTGPFAVGLLYFWAYVSWFSPEDGAVAAGALFLSVLFVWMKACQRRSAEYLLGERAAVDAGVWSWTRWRRELAGQLRLQSSSVILVPLAFVFTVPLPWIYGFYQSATVLPGSETRTTAEQRSLAWEQCRLWPKQHALGLLILSAVWLVMFINIAVTFYLIPSLATDWLGLKTIFALKGWSYLNSTFLALVVTLTHLSVDPLIKAFYLVRVFHGRSRKTGSDLRLVVVREKALRRRAAEGAALLLLLAVLHFSPSARATNSEERAPAVQTAPPEALDRSFNEVLKGPEFRWRLHPKVAVEKKKDGIVSGFVRATFQTIGQIVETIVGWIHDVSKWVSDLFPGDKENHKGKSTRDEKSATDWMLMLKYAAYGFLAVIGFVLLFVLYKVWQRNLEVRPLEAAPLPAPSATPDLSDETVQASQLPTDGWLELARQKMASGEWRLSLRALFLATLSRRAQEGLVSLAKFKTNQDYETELRRRARGQALVVDDFRGRRRQFEAVWYGASPADDAVVRDWLRQLEDKP